MGLYFYCFGDTGIKIWGLTVSERLARLLAGKASWLEDPARLTPSDEVLLFRGDYLLDDRLVSYLWREKDLLIFIEKDGQKIPLAAHVPASLFKETLSCLKGEGPPPSGITLRSLGEVRGDFLTHLKKFEPPFALEVRRGEVSKIEKRLFDWSYKGVTDLVTKWLWPTPARYVVKLCVRLGLKPNHITALSFILVLLAGYFFYRGRLGLGLIFAWVMTFFDTVDGKLARVTVTSSKFGHYFDHIIDLIHQPVWYILFALGAQKINAYHLEYSISSLATILLIFYVLGRLVEGAFSTFVSGFSIFTWRPIDSYFRLILARRNPCLILLTFSYFLGRPDYGYLATTVWMVVSSSFLLLRLFYALWERRRGPLKSWLSEVDRYRDHPLAIKWFTRKIPEN